MKKANNNPQRLSAYSSERKYYPCNHSHYVKSGSRWILTEEKSEILSIEQCGYVLDSMGLPGESRHQLLKKDRYSHSHSFDTFISWNYDGTEKSIWHIDFAKGDENKRKAIEKYWQRKENKNRAKQD